MQNGLVKSAIRVFDLLELFDAERQPLRVTSIARKLAAPQSSVSMLMKSLVARGYMEFDANTREYCPSVRVAFLGDWAARSPQKRDAIHDSMRRLADETGETVVLGRQNGILLQYVSVIESQNALRFSPAPGTMRPMHRTAVGIMLLSAQTDEQIGRLLRRYNAERAASDPIARITTTMRAVEVARENGYYESANLATPGAGAIATLLATSVRGRLMSIGVAAPVGRLHLQRKEFLRTVLSVAEAC